MSVNLIVALSMFSVGAILIVNGIYGLIKRKRVNSKKETLCQASSDTEIDKNSETQAIEMSFILPIENSDHKTETKIKTKKSSKAKKAKKSK